MSTVFKISGYFIDDLSEFDDFLVTDYDDIPSGYNEEDIFFFGITEEEIIEAIKTKEPVSDFCITEYTVIN